MSFDSVIEEKIGFGKTQYIPFAFLCLVDMNDGSQLVLSSFLTPIIKQEWNLTPAIVSLMASVFYMGIFFGSIISGKLADVHGRKKLITWGSLLQLLVSLLFAAIYSIEAMVIVRFLYGFAFGFTVSITTSMYAESASLQYRGKGLLLLNFSISFGKVYGVLLASIFLQDFSHGNWRFMMILSSLPNLIVLYGACKVIKQSPRFLLAQRQYEEAFYIIDSMIEENKGTQASLLTNKDKEILQQQSQQMFNQAVKPQLSFLLDADHSKTTITLSACWFFINFMYYGQLVILPFIFGKQHQSFTSYIVTILGQAPCLLVSMYLVDKPNFGRRTSMMYFFLAAGLFHTAFAFGMHPLSASIARFFMKQVFQMLYPCTTESFGTRIRTMGFGFCSAMGRVGAIIMPYTIFPLLDVSTTLIFLSFSLMSFLGGYSSYLIPKEPLNQPLDQKKLLIG